MRYVIGVLLITGGILWDAAYHDGHYLDVFFGSLRSLLAMIGVHV